MQMQMITSAEKFVVTHIDGVTKIKIISFSSSINLLRISFDILCGLVMVLLWFEKYGFKAVSCADLLLLYDKKNTVQAKP